MKSNPVIIQLEKSAKMSKKSEKSNINQIIPDKSEKFDQNSTGMKRPRPESPNNETSTEKKLKLLQLQNTIKNQRKYFKEIIKSGSVEMNSENQKSQQQPEIIEIIDIADSDSDFVDTDSDIADNETDIDTDCDTDIGQSDTENEKDFKTKPEENHVKVVLNSDKNSAKILPVMPKLVEKMVDQNHKCVLCFKRFSQKAKLNFHLLKVHKSENLVENENKTDNEIPEKSSKKEVEIQKQKTELQKQETEIQKQETEIQNRKKTFPCNICLEDFSFDSLLEVHQRTKHKLNKNDLSNDKNMTTNVINLTDIVTNENEIENKFENEIPDFNEKCSCSKCLSDNPCYLEEIKKNIVSENEEIIDVVGNQDDSNVKSSTKISLFGEKIDIDSSKQCGYCGKEFTRTSMLKKHILKNHSKENKNEVVKSNSECAHEGKNIKETEDTVKKDQNDKEELYHVEKIMDKFCDSSNGKISYLIKWIGKKYSFQKISSIRVLVDLTNFLNIVDFFLFCIFFRL